MATPTTLALQPRGTSVRRARKAAAWGERVRRLWQRMFARSDRAVAHDEGGALGYEALSGLDGRLLADIGAPEVLRDRARSGDDWRRQRAIDLERGYRTLGWRW